MLTKKEVEMLLEEAINRIAELDQFKLDSANLGLAVIANEFLVIKKFYEERVELLKMILKIPSLPF